MPTPAPCPKERAPAGFETRPRPPRFRLGAGVGAACPSRRRVLGAERAGDSRRTVVSCALLGALLGARRRTHAMVDDSEAGGTVLLDSRVDPPTPTPAAPAGWEGGVPHPPLGQKPERLAGDRTGARGHASAARAQRPGGAGRQDAGKPTAARGSHQSPVDSMRACMLEPCTQTCMPLLMLLLPCRVLRTQRERERDADHRGQGRAGNFPDRLPACLAKSGCRLDAGCPAWRPDLRSHLTARRTQRSPVAGPVLRAARRTSTRPRPPRGSEMPDRPCWAVSVLGVRSGVYVWHSQCQLA